MRRSRLILGSLSLLLLFSGVQCSDRDRVAKEKVISRFKSFVEAASKSDFAAAHAIMSPGFRSLQPESTTAQVAQELKAFGLVPESQWKVHFSSGEHAFICPHNIGPRNDNTPNSYGMKLVDGEWYLSGEIVNDAIGY